MRMRLAGQWAVVVGKLSNNAIWKTQTKMVREY